MGWDNDRYPGPASQSHNANPTRMALLRHRHPDCGCCQLALDELDRKAVASGRLRIEIMDLKAELKRLKAAGSTPREETTHVTDRDPPTQPVAAARCTHGVILSNRCAYCGKVWDDCEPA